MQSFTDELRRLEQTAVQLAQEMQALGHSIRAMSEHMLQFEQRARETGAYPPQYRPAGSDRQSQPVPHSYGARYLQPNSQSGGFSTFHVMQDALSAANVGNTLVSYGLPGPQAVAAAVPATAHAAITGRQSEFTAYGRDFS